MKSKHHFSPISITIYYLIFAYLWIFLSDHIVSLLYTDPGKIQLLQTYKGLFYVSLTALGLYFMIRHNNISIYKKSHIQEAVFKNSTFGIVIFTRTKISNHNHQFLEIMEFSSREIETKSFTEMIHPENLLVFKNILDRLDKGEKKVLRDVQILTTSGKIKWISIDCSTFDGVEHSYIAFLSDVSLERKYQTYTTLLMELMFTINTTDKLEQVFSTIIERLCRHIQCQLGEVWLPDESDTKLRFFSSWVSDKRFKKFIDESKSTKFERKEGFVGYVWSSKQLLWIEDIHSSPMFLRSEFAGTKDLKTAVGIPILIDKEIKAIIVLYSTFLQHRNQDFTSFIETISREISGKLEKRFDQERRIESENKLNFALQAAGLGTWEINYNDNTLSGDKTALSMLGYSGDKTVFNLDSHFKAIHPEDQDKVKVNLQKALSGAVDYISEYRVNVGNDTWRWFYSRGKVQKNDSSEDLCLSGILMDVTQRKIYEKELEKSEEKYRYLFEQSPMPLIVYDPESYAILNVNHSAATLYGYSHDQLKKMTITNIVNEEHQNEFKNFLKKSYLLKSSLPHNKSWKHIKKNGKIFTVDITIKPMNYEGKDAVIMLVYDITKEEIYKRELIKSEEKYRSLFDNSPLPYLIINPASEKIWDANQTAKKLFNITSNQFKDINLEFFFSDSEKYKYKELLNTVYEKGYSTVDTLCPVGNGELLNMSISANFVDYEGFKALLVTFSDTTEQKRTDEKILNSIIDGGDMERERIARELHDGVGQYLTASMLNLRSVAKSIDTLPENRQNQFITASELIEKATEDIRSMAHNLMPKTIADFGLATAVHTLAKSVTDITPIQIKFYTNLDENIRFSKQIEINIYRIIQEALNNIVKHSNAALANVQLMNYVDEIIITIEDNGSGFEQSMIKNSDGIGLKNIQNRVTSLSGSLDINSGNKNKRGTELTITIPKK